MNVNKKLDRLLHRAKEGMLGTEVKTSTSDEFNMLEQEMQLRHKGMDKLHRTMGTYVKSLSKQSEMEDKEKVIPVKALGSTMVAHGDDFEPESNFGNCLIRLGRANERIASQQEIYVGEATRTWLESIERSLAQMKEYQSSRKKLETRRLAYDTTLTKMQKAKKEDYRVEEELRSQKAKYEEASEDVFRRMQDIKEAEPESVDDLTSFLEAQLEYHQKCADILARVKAEWPVRSAKSQDNRRNRSRSNTAHDYESRFNPVEEEALPEPKLTIPKYSSRGGSATNSPVRPPISRSTTFEGPTRIQRDLSPVPMPHLRRVPTEPGSGSISRRPYLDTNQPMNAYDDQGTNSPFRNRSSSPAPSYGSGRSVSESSTPIERKKPPPPPPSRAKKPPPPPPVRRPV